MASLNGKSGGLFKNAKIIWLGVAILLVGVFVGTLFLLKSVYQTETYYVLNQDVPVRSQITMDMLTPVVTSAGTAPGGAPEMPQDQKEIERQNILSQVQAGSAFTLFPLKSGDVLSASNVAVLADISVGVPDSWVITSFSVDYNNAVQGRISRGTYFDIMVVADTGAYYPFVNMLALETATGGGTSSASGEDVSGMNSTTSVYTVGLSPENAAKLQWLQTFGSGEMKLVLSPRQNEYQAPALAEYEGAFYYDPLVDGVIAPGLLDVVDAEGQPLDVDGDGKADKREVTNYNFTDVERDQFGRPIQVIENYGLGNAKINEEEANGETPTNSNAEVEAAREECEAAGDYWVGGECSDEPAPNNANPSTGTSNEDQPLEGTTDDSGE